MFKMPESRHPIRPIKAWSELRQGKVLEWINMFRLLKYPLLTDQALLFGEVPAGLEIAVDQQQLQRDVQDPDLIQT